MPSTSLRPRKQKTIATRRSADSIYSKLGFEYNPAQMDRESFKHGFYAHNMGRPDTPQHVRRLLRGLNRHVETQDKIASAKDVGELLNPDFKAAVKGMTRKQQQRRYKRWEKIPVSNFTARMNALKKIHEASIDHVTPELYRGVAKISRELSKGGGHVRLGRDSIKVKPMKKLNFLERYVANKVGTPLTLARAHTRGKQKYTRDKRLQKKHFNLGGRIESLPGNFAQTAPHITHELLHIKDPGVGGSGDTRTYKEYLASRSEQHAYGGASILGVRHLKKMGVPHSLALSGLRAGDAGHAAAYVHSTRKKGIPEFIQKTINRKNISIAREFSGLPNQYLAGEAGERPRRKMARELYKGIERTYGARNTTGGTTNKFGQVKLARPISRLPEELQEKFDDFNFRINRYGQPDFREVDRGKPGDYTHWNIYKPDKEPVLRPKDPVVRRPARAQMDTPKPSTARDRALAWQRRNRGVAEEVDWAAKPVKIKSKLNPKKKESRIDQLRNKLSPVNIVYSSTGQPLSRYRTTPADLAKEVISTEVNHPQRHVWQRIGASQDQRASTVKRPQTVVNFNKQQLYDRVKALDLSLDKINLKKAYKGKL